MKWNSIFGFGLAVALAGVLACGWLIYNDLTSINAVELDFPLIRGDKAWEISSASGYQKVDPKHSRATHWAGPIPLHEDDSPYSMEWTSEDGGRKVYEFLFMFYSTEGSLVWKSFGTNRTQLTSNISTLTKLTLPIAKILKSGDYMLAASILDEKGIPAAAPSQIRFRKRAVSPRRFLPQVILMNGVFLQAAAVIVLGLAIAGFGHFFSRSR